MGEFLNRLIKEERGNVLVIVTVAMIALLGLTALVIDGGRLYFEKSMLQKAADAAALAGAQELPFNSEQAKTIAKSVASDNNVPNENSKVDIDNPDNMWIRVTTTSDVELTFGKLFRTKPVKVTATAKVELNLMTSGKGIFPLGVDVEYYENWKNCNNVKLKLGTPSEVGGKCDASGLGSGKAGFLDLDGLGQGAGNGNDGKLKDVFLYGSSKLISVNQEINTISGNKTSVLDEKREGDLVIVPVFTAVGNGNAINSVIVNGFASFVITHVGVPPGDMEVRGRFTGFINFHDNTPEHDEYRTYSYKLVE